MKILKYFPRLFILFFLKFHSNYYFEISLFYRVINYAPPLNVDIYDPRIFFLLYGYSRTATRLQISTISRDINHAAAQI